MSRPSFSCLHSKEAIFHSLSLTLFGRPNMWPWLKLIRSPPIWIERSDSARSSLSSRPRLSPLVFGAISNKFGFPPKVFWVPWWAPTQLGVSWPFTVSRPAQSLDGWICPWVRTRPQKRTRQWEVRRVPDGSGRTDYLVQGKGSAGHSCKRTRARSVSEACFISAVFALR